MCTYEPNNGAQKGKDTKNTWFFLDLLSIYFKNEKL